MGVVFSLYSYFFGGGEYKVVMVGLDNAGKSTILYRLCDNHQSLTPAFRAMLGTSSARAGTWVT